MSNMNSLEKDTVSRNKIVSEINKNFFVEAGAGSGKTTMLVSRMVAMVESGIPISKICAITFTKAAAGEFYDRFQKLLIERSNPDYKWVDKGFAGQLPAPTDKTRERCAEALRNIDLCFMGTIDSFCGMVLSEHPSEARIPSDASIMSDDDAVVLYKQIYVDICAGKYGEKLAGLAATFRSFYWDPEDVFVSAETQFMQNRNVDFKYISMGAMDIDKDFSAQKEEIVKAVKCLAEHPELMYDKNKESRAAWEKIEDNYKTLKKKWSLNFNNVYYALKNLTDVRVIVGADEKYGDSLGGILVPGGAKGGWLEPALGGEDGIFTKLGNFRYSASMDFLLACVSVIEDAMRDKGNMSYFDCLYYLRNMLQKDAKNDGKLIRYIYDRHSYFLIDEFQDTNPMQAEVFFYLSSKNPVEKWSSCVPRPGSLFIVGDPKQSIYRFRSADVTSFLHVKELFEKSGGEVLSLSRNFRSTRVLCDHFNTSFTAMLPEETADQSRFEEIPLPEETVGEFQGIYKYKAYTGKLTDMYPEETDSEQITRLIKKLVNNDEYLIRAAGDKEPRKIRYSDIMVITSAKKKLAPIMKRLDEDDIPTKVEGSVPFDTNVALIEIFKIYATIADIKDEISLYAALTGAFIGLTKNEILRYRQCGGKVSLKSSFEVEEVVGSREAGAVGEAEAAPEKDPVTDETALLVDSKIKMLRELYYKAQRLSPAALFAIIMDDFKVYEMVEAENLEVIYYTLELMRNAERAGIVVSLKDGMGYLSQLIAGESGEERCLSLNDEKDAVHMANLHKVKGLEAPIVILAAATAGGNNTIEKRIVHGEDGTEGYFFGLGKTDANGYTMGYYFQTNEFTDIKNEETAAKKAEGLRLIYVAATRARNTLIICESIQAAKNGECVKTVWKPVLPADAKYIIDPDISKEKDIKSAVLREKTDSAELYREAEESSVLNDRGMETRTYTIENPSRLHLSSKMSDEQDVNVEEEVTVGETNAFHKCPALLGTMTHKLMEMLVSTKNKVDVKEAVVEIIREFRTPAYEKYEADLKAALSDVADHMRNGGYSQNNDLPTDILSTLAGADEVYCEVPFCYVEDSEDPAEGKIIWNGVMDVVYCKDGRWHIVDYKTNADGSDLDKKYQAQLSAYIKAFKTTTGVDADAKTYHIDI